MNLIEHEYFCRCKAAIENDLPQPSYDLEIDDRSAKQIWEQAKMVMLKKSEYSEREETRLDDPTAFDGGFADNN